MNILIATDKFKGSISAKDVGAAIKSGLLSNNPDFNVELHPMADGGDGSLAIIDQYVEGRYISVRTIDALSRPVTSKYLLHNRTAYVELAEASGIWRLLPEERNPLLTTTVGTGYLVLDAIDRGANRVVLLLGGSCTTDAGLGIAYGIGFKFFNDCGDSLVPRGGNLQEVVKYEPPSDMATFQLEMYCDVNHTMHGPTGAAHVFGPQKGASPSEVLLLDQGLVHIANVIDQAEGTDIGSLIGGGSAGGISAGLAGLLEGEIVSGFDALAELSDLESKVAHSDLVISGEGKLDHTSLEGKVIGKLNTMCRELQKRLIVFAGQSSLGKQDIDNSAINKVLTLMDVAKSEADAMSNGRVYLELLARDLKL